MYPHGSGTSAKLIHLLMTYIPLSYYETKNKFYNFFLGKKQNFYREKSLKPAGVLCNWMTSVKHSQYRQRAEGARKVLFVCIEYLKRVTTSWRNGKESTPQPSHDNPTALHCRYSFDLIIIIYLSFFVDSLSRCEMSCS